jgi:hypothetical protein
MTRAYEIEHAASGKRIVLTEDECVVAQQQGLLLLSTEGWERAFAQLASEQEPRWREKNRTELALMRDLNHTIQQRAGLTDDEWTDLANTHPIINAQSLHTYAGEQSSSPLINCEVCGGTGKMPVPVEFDPNPPPCGRCNGTGRVRAWS